MDGRAYLDLRKEALFQVSRGVLLMRLEQGILTFESRHRCRSVGRSECVSMYVRVYVRTSMDKQNTFFNFAAGDSTWPIVRRPIAQRPQSIVHHPVAKRPYVYFFTSTLTLVRMQLK